MNKIDNIYRSALLADFSQASNNVNYIDFYEFFSAFIAGEFYNSEPNSDEWLRVENLFFKKMLEHQTIYISFIEGVFDLWIKDDKKGFKNLKTGVIKIMPIDWLVTYSFPLPNLLMYVWRMARIEADLFNNYKNSLIIRGKSYILTTNTTDSLVLQEEVKNILNPSVPFFYRYNSLLNTGELPPELEKMDHQGVGLSFDDILNFNNYWVSKTGFDVFKINKRERLISAEIEENKRANSNILFFILRSLKVLALDIYDKFNYKLTFNNDQSIRELQEELTDEN